MKGFQRTRTKAQNLTEISFKQNGFLTGLNLDSPKSDVGDTQVTALKNAIPYRDRIEARGGIKPLVGYYEKDSIKVANYSTFVGPMYDEAFDEFFSIDSLDGELKNYGNKNRSVTNCYDYTLDFGSQPDFYTGNTRVKDGFVMTTQLPIPFAGVERRIHFVEYRNNEEDYFLRPIAADVGSAGATINVYPSSSGEYGYSFLTSFVRIIDGIVTAESKIIGKIHLTHSVELDGSVTPFSLYRESTLYPNNLYDPSRVGTDNFYTHIRYYRTTLTENADNSDFYGDAAYYLTDYDINAADSLPGPGSGPTLNLNISDNELVSDASRAVVWQSGYSAVNKGIVSETSSGIFFLRNEDRPNEYIYFPVGSGDNRKYFGWYNPLFQYGSVDGDITSITDLGSYVIITTEEKTYYVDSVNYIEDEGQRSAGIFTPILSSSVLVSDKIGVRLSQKDAFVKISNGSAIGLSADGEIREFNGYQWGPDLSSGKVHAITKGKIFRGGLTCQGAFVNDAYYLYYNDKFQEKKMLRMGTTEESGYGFSEFYDGGFSLPDFIGATSQVFHNVKGSLVIWKPTGVGYGLYEYTGDKFDKKLNKDVLCSTTNQEWSTTTYYDINVEVEFPEMTGSSEYYFLYFLKSHFYLRADRYSYKVIDEGTTDGFDIQDNDLTPVSLSDASFGMDARIGEDDSVVASNDGFNAASGVTLSREVQDHRVRITLNVIGAGFQLTGMESHFKRHDRTQLDTTTDEGYVDSLVSGLYTRITQEALNLCIGQSRASTFDVGSPIEGARLGASPIPLLEGTAPTVIDGPDGANTGLSLVSGASLEFQAPSVATPTKASIMFWYKEFAGAIYTGWNRTGLHDYSFFSDGATWNIKSDNTDFVSSVVSSDNVWSHVAFIYDGAAWNIYKNGALGDTENATLLPEIKSAGVKAFGPSNVSDLRMYNKEITQDELLFYIDNVLNNEGDYFNGY